MLKIILKMELLNAKPENCILFRNIVYFIICALTGSIAHHFRAKNHLKNEIIKCKTNKLYFVLKYCLYNHLRIDWIDSASFLT